ncbi:beta-ketoacyl synthase N-terminal-like domain-containing protein [Micromonospora sp. NPDC049645]|uniref:type I polyketide synthase n=1 Tax=Micromonospora sp. NPDC049645 TaxID=3155508 RepID=UPI003419CAF5
MDRDTSLDIAVVGMDARFPDCVGLDDWVVALRAGQVLTRRYSRRELDRAGVPPSHLDDPGYVPVYGHLERVLRFDRAPFGMSRHEAELVDPQHRLMLETAWTALEDAGVPPRGSDERIGVFASSTGSTYLRAVLRQGDVDPATMDDLIHGAEPDFAASRIAHKLALRGVALSVQTACSSSLVAVHLAAQALLNGDCDRVLVVATGLTFPQAGYLHQTGGVLSASGHCRPFDARADGVVPGAGVVAVVLQVAASVPADAPTPHGVILATAVNNDGADKTGYYAPSVPGQREVITTAWQMAGVNIADAGYLEAHGTGTALGDPIEWEAATQAFRALGAHADQIPVGAVKANIGHLDAASGLAGLVKTLLVLRDRSIPPVAGFETANPLLRIDGSPLRIATGEDVLAPGAVAGVSSFGIGGTNAHAVLGAWPAPPAPAAVDDAGRCHGLALSAADPPALARGARALADWLDHGIADLGATADALTRDRSTLAYRVVVRAATSVEACEKLRRVDAGASPDSRRPPRVALLFPGQGTHYPGLARGLSAQLPHFDAHVRDVLAHLPESLRAEAERALWDPAFPADELRQTRLAQPVLFCAQYAAAAALRDLGVTPAAVIGHSLGEIVAATYAGGLTVPEAVRLVLARATAMQFCPPGRMASVALAEADVVALLAGTDLDLAAVNGPAHCVVAGAPDDVDRLVAKLAGTVRVRRLDTDRAFHSRLVQPALDDIAAVAAPSRPLSTALVSTVTGRVVGPGRTLPAGHFVHGARRPVRFAEAARTLVDGHPGGIVIEVGPGRSLSALVELAGARAIPLQRSRDADGVADALDALWSMGVADRVAGPRTTGRRHRPPGYAFGGEEYSLVGTVDAPATTPASTGPVPPAPVDGTGVDRIVRAGWRETLGVDPEDETADFFDLGGDSLAMIRLLRRLEVGLRSRLPLPELMARPTLRAHIQIASEAVR